MYKKSEKKKEQQAIMEVTRDEEDSMNIDDKHPAGGSSEHVEVKRL